MTLSDFQIGATKTGGIATYSSFDPIFTAEVKKLGATFGRTAAGRAQWALSADKADAFPAFRAACAGAAKRSIDAASAKLNAAQAAFAAMPKDAQARWYDAVQNEGGEGYNPYRSR